MGRLTTDKVIPKVHELRGNLSAVARALGVSRTTLYKFLQAHPTAQQAVEEARETMLDHAESMLYRKVLDGDTTALIFFLKTQGRRRGYVERVETTGRDGGPVQIEARYEIAQSIMNDPEALAHASEIIRRLSERVGDERDGGD